MLDITAAHLSAQSPAVDKVETEKRISELENDKRKAVSAEEYKKLTTFKMKSNHYKIN